MITIDLTDHAEHNMLYLDRKKKAVFSSPSNVSGRNRLFIYDTGTSTVDTLRELLEGMTAAFDAACCDPNAIWDIRAELSQALGA